MSKLFSVEDISQFKNLFSKYCRQEINNGICDEYDCDYCYINKAYMEIFDTLSDDAEED